MSIDLNCDMGEGYGVYRLGLDEEAMPLVTSANVACGFHASDPGTMHRTVRLARRHGVSVGAHPSYPDRIGFGRRPLGATPAEIHDDVLYQVGALSGFCRAEGLRLQHVKPHGALYNAAAKDLAVALAVAEAAKALDPALWLVCLAGSALVEAARRTGLRHVQEAFADRAYASDGSLVPRSVEGSVLHDAARVEEQVARMVRERKVVSIDGVEVPIDAGTICVHGDTPGAVGLIRAIRARLARERIDIRPFSKEDTT
jgi:5-oxoprolinase (ATP-hydrolysing) subunit A